MQMIQALDEYEDLGHSGRVLRPCKRLRRQGHSIADDAEDEMTSDKNPLSTDEIA